MTTALDLAVAQRVADPITEKTVRIHDSRTDFDRTFRIMEKQNGWTSKQRQKGEVLAQFIEDELLSLGVFTPVYWKPLVGAIGVAEIIIGNPDNNRVMVLTFRPAKSDHGQVNAKVYHGDRIVSHRGWLNLDPDNLGLVVKINALTENFEGIDFHMTRLVHGEVPGSPFIYACASNAEKMVILKSGEATVYEGSDFSDDMVLVWFRSRHILENHSITITTNDASYEWKKTTVDTAEPLEWDSYAPQLDEEKVVEEASLILAPLPS